MSKETEALPPEDLRSEFERLIGEHKGFLGGAVAIGTLAVGGYFLAKFFIAKRKNLEPELKRTVEELEELLTEQTTTNLDALPVIEEMGQSIQDSGDPQALNILKRIPRALDHYFSHDDLPPRDLAIVASVRITATIKAFLNQEKKE